MMKLQVTQHQELIILIGFINEGYAELSRIWTVKLVRMVLR